MVFGGYEYFSGKTPASIYTTEGVSRGNLAQTVSATGKIASSMQMELSFALTGKIDSELVDVGDKVVAGQKIASIDASTFPQQLKQAEMNVKIQKETLDDMKKNKNANSIDQRDAQRATVEKAQAAYDAVLRQAADNSLYAPIDGMIIKKNVDLGEMATVGAAVFTIANPDDFLIESNIPEADIVDVSAGQKANITFDALSEDEIFPASVVSVDPASTVIQDVVFYRVKLRLGNSDSRLKIGMSCNDDIVTANAENILMIPQRAVKKEDGKKYVEILKTEDKIETVEKRYVETGLTGDNGMIEVKNGLKEGEKVVTFTKAV